MENFNDDYNWTRMIAGNEGKDVVASATDIYTNSTSYNNENAAPHNA